tara:strand:+ start:258 stop:404 length:147 start_codon:yes stop_codon:yes gene_type:complete
VNLVGLAVVVIMVVMAEQQLQDKDLLVEIPQVEVIMQGVAEQVLLVKR